MNIKTKFADMINTKAEGKNQNTLSTKQHNMKIWY